MINFIKNIVNKNKYKKIRTYEKKGLEKILNAYFMENPIMENHKVVYNMGSKLLSFESDNNGKPVKSYYGNIIKYK